MNTIKYILLFFIVMTSKAYSQCKSGDCKNGTGTYDFGWCIYTGQFKNEKPDGNGLMKYDDYTFEGSFKDGLEDGKGTITYKNGKKENVFYNKGTKIKADEKVAASDWKELEGQSDDCIKGNCITGFGTVLFASGNKYVGNFVNRKKHGNGVFYFTNGDKFEGVFKNDLKDNGTYTFNNGYTYTGEFLNDDFYNGMFKAPSGNSVAMNNGKVVTPLATITSDEKGTGCQNKVSCPRCHGKAIESKPIEQKLSWSTKDTYSVDRYGNKTTNYVGQSGGGTYQIPNYVACSRCGGKGFICK
ncbi:hypothetical protein [Pedobacter foliorum]|uniref:hypothetical protein n=1 Tax=Pedobacter foliorum TaxID=2739058 RepID=UPI0015655790|nr:hypothetical protein [Pedobacter foliorum]NRF40880.1 hypothetical protein [Pedobacter foliorum]